MNSIEALDVAMTYLPLVEDEARGYLQTLRNKLAEEHAWRTHWRAEQQVASHMEEFPKHFAHVGRRNPGYEEFFAHCKCGWMQSP
jgi:hypothetical protein